MSYAAVCNVVTGDFDCYEETKTIDANSHQDTGYVDGWGRAIYAKSYTGNSGGTYAVYATTKQAYRWQWPSRTDHAPQWSESHHVGL